MWRLRNSVLRTCMVTPVAGLVLLSPAAAIDATIQARVCDQFAAPAIISPVSGMETGDMSLIVSGSGEPGLTISVDNSGVIVGATTVAPNGSFALQIPLASGSNTLIARETNECDTTKQSQPVTVATTLPADNGQSPPAAKPSAPELSPKNQPAKVGSPIISMTSSLGFQKPTVTYPHEGGRFIDSVVWVTGRAYAGSLVSVYVNGINTGNIIASTEGAYGEQVNLLPGSNTIQVKSALGDQSAVSDKITVIYAAQEPKAAADTTGAATVGVVGASSLAGVGIAMWRLPSIRFRGRWK